MQSGVLTLDEVEEVPEALAGKWSYIMWEAAGCPSRSKEDADAEYRTGIKELQACLCRGKTVDELWKVANGEVRACTVALLECQPPTPN